MHWPWLSELGSAIVVETLYTIFSKPIRNKMKTYWNYVPPCFTLVTAICFWLVSWVVCGSFIVVISKMFFPCLCKGCPGVQQQAFRQGLPGNSFKLPLHCVAFDLLPHVSYCSWVGCHKVSCRRDNEFNVVMSNHNWPSWRWLSRLCHNNSL